MTPELRNKLRALLTKHEGYRKYVYMDSVGVPTVGIGRNLRDKGLSMDEALYLLNDDMDYFSDALANKFDWWVGLDENRKAALIDMCFNLGMIGFLKFSGMLVALSQKNYSLAARAMMQSKWATQVGQRAIDLSTIIRTGEVNG